MIAVARINPTLAHVAGVRRAAGRRLTRLGPVAMSILLLVLVGCQSKKPADGTDEAQTLSQTKTVGPVTLTLSATPAEVKPGAPLHLTIQAVTDKSVTLHFDDYQQALRRSDDRFDFRVVQCQMKSAQPRDDGKLQWTQACQLEFVLPGEYELPSATVSYETVPSNETAPDADTVDSRKMATLRDVRTEPLAMVVLSKDDEKLSEKELATLAMPDPVELTPPWRRWWWVAPILVALGGVLLFFLVRVWRRRRNAHPGERVIVIPAHEWALAALAKLIDEDLVARGEVQAFYYRISDIVRGYVERRFRVCAPDMTTEEFLETAARDRRFGQDSTEALQGFLTACDLVKYARQQPGPHEADQLIGATRDFVEQTRRHDEFSSAESSNADRQGAAA